MYEAMIERLSGHVNIFLNIKMRKFLHKHNQITLLQSFIIYV